MTNKLQISSYGEGILEAVILSGVEGWSVGQRSTLSRLSGTQGDKPLCPSF